MDISDHHKFTSGTWEPYNLAMEDHQVLHDDPPFDHSQWPYFLPIQNHHATSNSPSAQLLSSPNLLGGNDHLKGEGDQEDEPEEEELGAMKEMMFKIAAMQPVDIDPATIRKPRRRNVRISDDPQSVAARHRRERISEKIRILQRLVPGGTKMDTASMLDEAIRYVKFLKRQIRILQGNNHQPSCIGVPTANDWAVETTKAAASATPGTSNLFWENNDDGAAGDDSVCFSHNFIRD